MKKTKQPAKLSYFFGPGWRDLVRYIRLYWECNQSDIQKQASKVETGKGIMSLKGARNLVSAISLILFGSLFFLIISATVSVVLGIAFLVVYVWVLFFWLLDRVILLARGIFVACPNCKHKYLVPVYLCPDCGARHTRLLPGKYGVFMRTCNCGRKLPTHILTNRGRLAAECPTCGYSLHQTASRPLCVPVIGGRSAGKTAYITAFSYEFIERVAPASQLMIQHYSAETEAFYRSVIVRDYLEGTTRMTKTETDLQQASSKAFSFLVGGGRLKPSRLVQIYDVAGESFIENTENEEQLQYTYCHGIVFILDPLSVPAIRNGLDESVSENDRNSVGTMDVDLVLDAFLNKLRQVTGETSKSVSSIPVAVVISKADIEAVNRHIGEQWIREYMAAEGMGEKSYSVAQDRVCRQFLSDNGLGGFVNSIDMKFKYNRYFQCSAIGHTREEGSYRPSGVLEPMEWIFGIADSTLGGMLKH